MAADPHSIASTWLSDFSSAFEQADAHAIPALFLTEGWLRDLLVFTWNFRSLHGRDKVVAYLSEFFRVRTARITDVRFDTAPELTPRMCTAPSGQECVEFAFAFELPHGPCRGYTRLLPDASGTYRALTVMVTLSELRGCEELGTLPLRDDIAARFKQINIPTLVIDRNDRVGDSWRKRYPSLTLHNARRHHTLLYQPFPSNWPEYTPRDKLADWLECYVTIQDLVVWTHSELYTHPKYDFEAQRWEITVLRNGTEVKLRPAHIVFATGQAGRPLTPNIADMERFHGELLHTAEYPGGAPFAGKRVVVIGAGNSSIDICQDLVLHGAESVTMVQRSETCVVSRENMNKILKANFPEDGAIQISDLKFASMPIGLLKSILSASQDVVYEMNREVHEKLRKGGLNVTLGEDGVGPYILYYQRGGGYWLDKGGADLIEDGSIKVKSGVSPQRFTEGGLVLSDGSELDADVVVFATGFHSLRESNMELLGEDVMKHVGPVYGLDEEGEINANMRPCGHPGLWFAAGDIPLPRFFSKHLVRSLIRYG
ncbi:dimethylaniline monooxygenase (N-oxide-forming) [Fomes fomentarius]|nr:dimethylaniline monooxygenase (N-oxide-forming) [Fomes fomentarius]